MNKDSHDGSAASRLSDSQIIDRFGGIRPMAAKLGVAVTTVQGWKARGHIPENRRPQILQAAKTAGVDLGEDGAAAPTAAAPVSPAAGPRSRSSAESAAPPDRTGEAKKPEPPKPDRLEKTEKTEKKESKPPTHTPPPSAEPKAAPAHAGRVAWIALAIAVLLMAAVFTRPYWEPVLYGSRAGGAPAADLSGIERTLDGLAGELSGRVAALEAGGGETGAVLATRLATLERNLADLERTLGSLNSGMRGVDERLAALEAARGEVPESVTAALRQAAADIEAMREAVAALRTETATQDERLTELETRPVQTGERIAALALAIGQVEAALSAGRPYRAALERLIGIAPDDQLILDGVSVLYDRSADGIPGRPALQRRFSELAPDIGRALADTGGDSWVDRAWHSLSTVITVRRKDGPDSSPVSKAEAAMANGDLAGALKALDGAGTLGAAGDAWLQDVRARVEAEEEIEALYGRVIAQLAATGEPVQ